MNSFKPKSLMDRLLSVKSSSQLGQAASFPSTEGSMKTFHSDPESVVIDEEEEDKENIAEPFVKEKEEGIEVPTLEITNATE